MNVIQPSRLILVLVVVATLIGYSESGATNRKLNYENVKKDLKERRTKLVRLTNLLFLIRRAVQRRWERCKIQHCKECRVRLSTARLQDDTHRKITIGVQEYCPLTELEYKGGVGLMD